MELRPLVISNRYNQIDDKYHITIVGQLAFICPQCGEITYVPVVFSYQNDDGLIEYDVYKYEVTCCKCNAVFWTSEAYGPNIAELVVALNKKGYTVLLSCEGHTTLENSWCSPLISFADASVKEHIKDLPDEWKWVDPNKTNEKAIMRCDYLHYDNYFYNEGWKPKLIEDLTAWVNNLPSLVDNKEQTDK